MSDDQRSRTDTTEAPRAVEWEHIDGRGGGLRDLVADAVLRERTARRWSQAKLAEELARHGCTLSRNAIATIETGTRRVDLDEAYFFCRVFDIGLGELLVRGKSDDGIVVMPDNARLDVEEVATVITGRHEGPNEQAWVENIVRSEVPAWLEDIVRSEVHLMLIARQITRETLA